MFQCSCVFTTSPLFLFNCPDYDNCIILEDSKAFGNGIDLSWQGMYDGENSNCLHPSLCVSETFVLERKFKFTLEDEI